MIEFASIISAIQKAVASQNFDLLRLPLMNSEPFVHGLKRRHRSPCWAVVNMPFFAFLSQTSEKGGAFRDILEPLNSRTLTWVRNIARGGKLYTAINIFPPGI